MYSIGVEPISSWATFLLCLSLLCVFGASGDVTGYECSTATSEDSNNSAVTESLVVVDLP